MMPALVSCAGIPKAGVRETIETGRHIGVRGQRTEPGDQVLCPGLAELGALTHGYGAQRLNADCLEGAEAIGSIRDEAAVQEPKEPLGEALAAPERGSQHRA